MTYVIKSQHSQIHWASTGLPLGFHWATTGLPLGYHWATTGLRSHCPPDSLIFPQVGVELSSSMTALQAEKERLMRSVSEKEAELSSLRQSALAEQSSLQVEREKSSRDLGNLQSMLQEKVSQLPPRWEEPCQIWTVEGTT